MVILHPNDLRQSSNRPERGQALVELAICFTFLMILLAGAVDLGRAFYSYITLQDAAEEGASYGSFQPGDDNGIRSRVKNYSNYPIDFSTFPDSQIEISYSGSYCAGNQVQVLVRYTLNLVTPLLGTLVGTQDISLAVPAKATILSPLCP